MNWRDIYPDLARERNVQFAQVRLLQMPARSFNSPGRSMKPALFTYFRAVRFVIAGFYLSALAGNLLGQTTPPSLHPGKLSEMDAAIKTQLRDVPYSMSPNSNVTTPAVNKPAPA